MITTIKLNGLTCQACQKVTQNRIGKITGVNSVKVDLNSGLTEINANKEITREEVVKALEGTPYTI